MYIILSTNLNNFIVKNWNRNWALRQEDHTYRVNTRTRPKCREAWWHRAVCCHITPRFITISTTSRRDWGSRRPTSSLPSTPLPWPPSLLSCPSPLSWLLKVLASLMSFNLLDMFVTFVKLKMKLWWKKLIG